MGCSRSRDQSQTFVSMPEADFLRWQRSSMIYRGDCTSTTLDPVHPWNTRAVSCALMLTATVLGTACSNESVARETFSRERSCPLDGITAKEHPEISAYGLTHAKAQPPPDIAADPARLAVWKANEDQSKKQIDNIRTVVEVAGCNEKAYYTCSHNGKSGRRTCSRS